MWEEGREGGEGEREGSGLSSESGAASDVCVCVCLCVSVCVCACVFVLVCVREHGIDLVPQTVSSALYLGSRPSNRTLSVWLARSLWLHEPPWSG